MLSFDGLPNDDIYNRGADRRTRLQQTADGSIALNGGGGKIFRDHFDLPDRTFTVRYIVRTFYRGFSRGVFRDCDGLANCEARLAASVWSIVSMSEAGNERLTRASGLRMM